MIEHSSLATIKERAFAKRKPFSPQFRLWLFGTGISAAHPLGFLILQQRVPIRQIQVASSEIPSRTTELIRRSSILQVKILPICIPCPMFRAILLSTISFSIRFAGRRLISLTFALTIGFENPMLSSCGIVSPTPGLLTPACFPLRRWEPDQDFPATIQQRDSRLS